jgi:hypothetical protein
MLIDRNEENWKNNVRPSFFILLSARTISRLSIFESAKINIQNEYFYS